MTKHIKILLVDDEKGSREVLGNLLTHYFPELEIAGEASNVEDAYTLIREQQPQLVFLDIQMPRASGFNLLSKFREIPFEVIFVTSYDQYAINAIKFNALDYLLKPVEINDLQTAVKKAIHTIEKKISNSSLVINLLHSISADAPDKKIAIHAGENVKLLPVQHILCVEADGRYCHLTTNRNETYTTAKYLKDFEDYFAADVNFIRISKSLMINSTYIKQYSKGEPCIIELINGKTVEVSRRKKQEILERLKATTK